MPTQTVTVGSIRLGQGCPLALIAGPCVIESRRGCLNLAGRLAELAARVEIPLIFKASFDKANRTSLDAFRGPGMEAGLEILAEVKHRFGLPLLTDIHTEAQADPVAQVVDVLQIPAFLSRQTDLIVAAARTGRVVNVKKGQFMAAEDMRHVVDKLVRSGNRKILLTERGVSFGYRNLVADLRNLPLMRALGYPVVFDATHSVQRPGGGDGQSLGDARWAPALARAAVAVGCDGVFVETAVDPRRALSDAANSIKLSDVERLWRQLAGIHALIES